jgi:NADPH-dependent 7-cyano-7-deazaguanine reductase QueF-like protein
MFNILESKSFKYLVNLCYNPIFDSWKRKKVWEAI